MRNKLTILGSGTCLSSFYKPFDFRYPSGYLLQTGGDNILLDCSEGVRARFEQIKFDYYDLSHIFISHFHPDHFSLATFLQAFYVRAKKTQQEKKLTVYGPPEIEKRLSIIWENMHVEGHFQKEFQKTLTVDFREFADGKEFNLSNNIKALSYEVDHAEMTAYSTRFILGNKVICYSGDSGVSENLIKSARDSDLFICEAAMKVGETDQDNAHLNPGQAGEIAHKANSKALILTHYHGSSTDGEMLGEVARSGYTGKAIVAKDFQSFEL